MLGLVQVGLEFASLDEALDPSSPGKPKIDPQAPGLSGFVSLAKPRTQRPALDHQFPHQETLAASVQTPVAASRSGRFEARDRGEKIKSIALPPLGCGNGGLEWDQVRPAIEAALSALKGVNVTVFEPSSAYGCAPQPS